MRKPPRHLGLIVLGFGLSVLGTSLLFLGIDRSDASIGSQQLFQTSLLKVTPTAGGEWRVSGKTAAPNGAKIIALGDNDVATVASHLDNPIRWARVRNGHFQAAIDAYHAVADHDYQAGRTIPVTVVAVTNYSAAPYNLLPAALRDQLQQFGPQQLVLTKLLAKSCWTTYHEYQ